ncbi:hypothetical protein HK100_006668 [Physocladia obscura]|uniref:Serine hydrolase domain-containing protein n=1 Tax=Physocladia obscura TaxID=109957 RepID=A0AAD5T537_9FUNG|nr:hypothetical protein HK100_006668 [Physocladia obscura]
MDRCRILCLHGYAQNEQVFRKRSAVLRKDLEKIGVELVYATAPHTAPPPDQEADTMTEAERSLRHGVQKPEEVLRGWWLSNIDKTGQIGYAESIHSLKAIWAAQGPFDGILGFSQGAALAPLLVSELAFASKQSDFAASQFALPKFMIIVSGFISVAVKNLADANVPVADVSGVQDSILDAWPEGKIPISSMHVIGNGDVWVVPRESHALAARFVERSRLIVEHDGGHYIPTSAEMRLKFKEFVQAHIATQ